MSSVGLRSGLLVAGLCALAASERIDASQHPPRPLSSVPFLFFKNEIVATVRINHKGPFTVLLDTGTAPSVIDVSVARKIGLKLVAEFATSDGGGTEKHQDYETTLPNVELGKLNTPKVAAVATDLSGLTKRFGKPIDAVLGDSFFSNRVVQFDYANKIFRLYNRSPILGSEKTKKSTTVPFRHDDGEVHFSGVRINGKAVSANLDTGSNGEFSLTPQGIRALNLDQQAANGESTSAAGFNGKYKAQKGTLDLVEFGEFRVRQAPVTYWSVGTGHDNSHWDVNVGNLFLMNYIVTIDYQANVLTLTHYKPWKISRRRQR